jgi:hypothetical protein
MTGQLGRLVLRSAASPGAREELVGQLALGPGWYGLPLLVPTEELGRWCPDLGPREALASTLGVHADAPVGEDSVPGARLGDGSLWVQAVHAEREPELHALLVAHGERTGTAALLAAPLQRDDLTLALGVREGQEAVARRGLELLVVLGDGAESTALATHEEGALAP